MNVFFFNVGMNAVRKKKKNIFVFKIFVTHLWKSVFFLKLQLHELQLHRAAFLSPCGTTFPGILACRSAPPKCSLEVLQSALMDFAGTENTANVPHCIPGKFTGNTNSY